MLQKFRDMVAVSKNLEGVDNKLNALHEEAKFLTRHIEDMKSSLEQMHGLVQDTAQTQTKLLKKFKEDLDMIGEIRENFKQEMFNFKLSKNEWQKELMEKFAETLEQEMLQRKEEIKIDASEYVTVKQGIQDMSTALGTTSNEITKFNEIARKIKAEDFALVKFTGQIKDIENEKLALLQKIDTLERLISKMRRTMR